MWAAPRRRMRSVISGLSDRALALGLTAGGTASIVLAFTLRAHPFDMSPAMDGVYTCGLLGIVLPLLHGVGWRRALRIAVPIAMVQLACFVSRGVMALAPLGVEALLVGLVGMVVVLLDERRDAQPLMDSPQLPSATRMLKR